MDEASQVERSEASELIAELRSVNAQLAEIKTEMQGIAATQDAGFETMIDLLAKMLVKLS